MIGWVIVMGVADLTGKVAIVTGGARGIGLAIARALLEAGARVAITATSDSSLQKGLKELESVSDAGALLAIKVDVRHYADVEAAVDKVAERFGGLDILVNNAGIGIFSPVADMSLDQWHQVIDTNLSGVFHCCLATISHLRQRGGGWIINISSLAGKNPFPEAAAYCASKAGLNAFSEALMQEVRHDGIRVAYVMPGSVRTEFSGRRLGGDEWKLAPEDVAEVVTDLLGHPSRSLPSRVEMRPSRPPRKS
jgi:NAD(P)-dependent dehydrogenase (short-subunit alcohol dehydrogenase family)